MRRGRMAEDQQHLLACSLLPARERELTVQEVVAPVLADVSLSDSGRWKETLQPELPLFGPLKE